MVSNTTMTTAALLATSTSRAAVSDWQTTSAANGNPATHVFAGMAAGYAIGGFAAPAVVADKHSRLAKPAAPPRGLR